MTLKVSPRLFCWIASGLDDTYQATTKVSTCQHEVQTKHGRRPWRQLLILNIMRNLGSYMSILDLSTMFKRDLFVGLGIHVCLSDETRIAERRLGKEKPRASLQITTHRFGKGSLYIRCLNCRHVMQLVQCSVMRGGPCS
jgi:hypothetical protein